MSLIAEIRALDPDRRELRRFGWTVGGAFLLLGAFLAWRGAVAYPWLLGIGGALAALGLVLPSVLRPLFLGWMSLALALGFVMTRVLLTLFFVLVLVPVGLVFRLFGRDPLSRKLDPGAESYWIDKEYPIEDRSRLEKFF